METILIISRRGNEFDVTPVEIDPHTTQGQQALKDAINEVSQTKKENVEHVLAFKKD